MEARFMPKRSSESKHRESKTPMEDPVAFVVEVLGEKPYDKQVRY